MHLRAKNPPAPILPLPSRHARLRRRAPAAHHLVPLSVRVDGMLLVPAFMVMARAMMSRRMGRAK